MSNPGLTPREQEVMRFIAQGKTREEAAGLMRISDETVKFHLTNIRLKMNAVTTLQAVTIAITRGFLILDVPSPKG